MPYGTPTLENSDQYIAFFSQLPPDKQYIWTTRFIDKTNDIDLALAKKLVLKMSIAPNFVTTMSAVKELEFPGELTSLRIRLSTCWHNVAYTVIVNKTDTDDSILELGQWILDNHYPQRAFFFVDANPLSITIEKNISDSETLCLHVTEHGSELGFYQNFTLYPTDDYANEFVPMTTRKAMIDNFLARETDNTLTSA